MRLVHLPPESAVAGIVREGKLHWTLEAHLLDDLRMAMTGSKKNPAKPHPMRPKGKAKRMTMTQRRKLHAARARAAERRRLREEGLL